MDGTGIFCWWGVKNQTKTIKISMYLLVVIIGGQSGKGARTVISYLYYAEVYLMINIF